MSSVNNLSVSLPPKIVASDAVLATGTRSREAAIRIAAARREALRKAVWDYAGGLMPGRYRVLELGCGHGHFLTAYGEAFPGHDCLGLDYCKGRIEKACRKAERRRLGNVQFLRGSAEDLLATLPDSLRFDRVFILFPDPWPKRKHRKNRMVKPSFLSLLGQIVSPGAALFFRTDHSDYYAEVRRAVEDHADWTLQGETEWPFEYTTVFQAKAPSHHSLCALRTEQARQ